jgi:hypothetical protein
MFNIPTTFGIYDRLIAMGLAVAVVVRMEIIKVVINRVK